MAIEDSHKPLKKGKRLMKKRTYQISSDYNKSEDELKSMSDRELRALIVKMDSAANKRLRRLEKAGMSENSNAYKYIRSATSGTFKNGRIVIDTDAYNDPEKKAQFSVDSSMSSKELRARYQLVNNFLQKSSSSVTGIKKNMYDTLRTLAGDQKKYDPKTMQYVTVRGKDGKAKANQKDIDDLIREMKRDPQFEKDFWKAYRMIREDLDLSKGYESKEALMTVIQNFAKNRNKVDIIKDRVKDIILSDREKTSGFGGLFDGGGSTSSSFRDTEEDEFLLRW